MTTRHNIHEPHPLDEESMTLTYIARELGLSSDKAVYIARRRHQIRVAAGSEEEPFPSAVPSPNRRGEQFLFRDVRLWLQGHTRTNNPRSKKAS